ncbi:hypothetical protein I7I50_05625 [Histoplasma capsulatum G186AR]|uniref:Uncharacterized protein n=1 Tax=Ajellomyces capsulatus TaxID=5037 RepID=A0A8H7ZCL3_AJECA|nr:hypothetical protein I7I52_03885 [Histoplasma capsulatum]QSS76239.1 hypothetical protein I7I50_05625 [Histoplasma capsulatum G186AR]
MPNPFKFCSLLISQRISPKHSHFFFLMTNSTFCIHDNDLSPCSQPEWPRLRECILGRWLIGTFV